MGKAWFAPKRFGYGAGMPIAWQGWVVMIGFIAAIIALLVVSRMLVEPLASRVTICGSTVLIALLIAIARAKTDGGWRWRWGDGP